MLTKPNHGSLALVAVVVVALAAAVIAAALAAAVTAAVAATAKSANQGGNQSQALGSNHLSYTVPAASCPTGHSPRRPGLLEVVARPLGRAQQINCGQLMIRPLNQ